MMVEKKLNISLEKNCIKIHCKLNLILFCVLKFYSNCYHLAIVYVNYNTKLKMKIIMKLYEYNTENQ